MDAAVAKPIIESYVATDYEWTIARGDYTPYLTFSSDGSQSLTLKNSGFTLESGEKFEYKLGNGAWSTLEFDTAVEFGGAKGMLKLRGNSSKGTAFFDGEWKYCNVGFSGTSPVECTGDIRTLVDYTTYSEANTAEAKFRSLFINCTVLTSAPSLPATTLASDCYSYMFSGCTSLKTAPSLPATTLAQSCYSSMFNGCSSLTAAPSLPATTLAPYCYDSMFSGCKSLSTAPETLPAMELKEYCYQRMFQECALINAPELPATILAEKCYYAMFSVCTSMVSGPSVLPATELVKDCYGFMFELCSKLAEIDIKATINISSSALGGMLAYTADGTNGIINCTQEFNLHYS